MPSFEEILDLKDEDRQLDEVRLYFKNLGANSSSDIGWAFYNLVEAYLEHLKGYRRKEQFND